MADNVAIYANILLTQSFENRTIRSENCFAEYYLKNRPFFPSERLSEERPLSSLAVAKTTTRARDREHRRNGNGDGGHEYPRGMETIRLFCAFSSAAVPRAVRLSSRIWRTPVRCWTKGRSVGGARSSSRAPHFCAARCSTAAQNQKKYYRL